MTTLSVSEKVFAVEIAGEALTVSVAADVVRVLEVGVAGPQGPAGAAGHNVGVVTSVTPPSSPSVGDVWIVP